MNLPVKTALRALFVASAAGALSACVVAPIDHYPSHAPTQVLVVPAPAPMPSAEPAPQYIAVKLYPSNDTAQRHGVLTAQVLDRGNGRGTFTVAWKGQTLEGDATRVGRDHPNFGAVLASVHGGNWNQTAGQRGLANAANTQHNLRCEYIFTRPGQGVGACLGGDGAKFQLHFGG